MKEYLNKYISAHGSVLLDYLRIDRSRLEVMVKRRLITSLWSKCQKRYAQTDAKVVKKKYEVQETGKIRNIGILAHIDAGSRKFLSFLKITYRYFVVFFRYI